MRAKYQHRKKAVLTGKKVREQLMDFIRVKRYTQPDFDVVVPAASYIHLGPPDFAFF